MEESPAGGEKRLETGSGRSIKETIIRFQGSFTKPADSFHPVGPDSQRVMRLSDEVAGKASTLRRCVCPTASTRSINKPNS